MALAYSGIEELYGEIQAPWRRQEPEHRGPAGEVSC